MITTINRNHAINKFYNELVIAFTSVKLGKGTDSVAYKCLRGLNPVMFAKLQKMTNASRPGADFQLAKNAQLKAAATYLVSLAAAHS